MKLALYLPNFREKVTVKELEDLTALAEELDFDSVWTLDRVIVPESSDRGEMEYAFGMIPGFPKQLPVSSRGEFLQGWPLIPWLAAIPGDLTAVAEFVDGGPVVYNVGVGSGWMPEEFAAASASHIFPKRHTHVRATLESCKASGPTRSSSTTASSPTSARAGSGSSRCRSRIRRSTSPA